MDEQLPAPIIQQQQKQKLCLGGLRQLKSQNQQILQQTTVKETNQNITHSQKQQIQEEQVNEVDEELINYILNNDDISSVKSDIQQRLNNENFLVQPQHPQEAGIELKWIPLKSNQNYDEQTKKGYIYITRKEFIALDEEIYRILKNIKYKDKQFEYKRKNYILTLLLLYQMINSQ